MVEAKTVFIWFTRFVKVVAVLGLLLYGVALGMLARSSVESITLDNQGKAFAVLSYIGYMVFVLALIVAEFGFQWFEKGVFILHFWLGRGLFLGWMGVQASNQAEQMVAVVAGAQSTIDPQTLKTLSQVVGWLLISIGLLYIIMSLLCLQRLLGLKSMEEVDSGFSNLRDGDVEEGRAGGNKYQESSSHLSVPLNADDEDVRLMQNAASALGMTVRELRNKFGGANGSREAQRYFDDKQAQLSAAREAAKQAVNNKPKEDTKGKGKEKESQRSFVPPPGASATAPPPSGRFEAESSPRAFHDDDDQRGRGDDDDLEAMYYAATKGGAN